MTTPQYDEYLKSDRWKVIRQQALERAGFRCQVCNSPDGPEAHHRTYERLGAELPEDLTVLCNDCHALFHESKSTTEIITLFDSLKEAYAAIDQRASRNPNEFDGVVSGFVDLDQLTAGFHSSELIILAARPSVGKTAMALNMVRHLVVEKQLPVLFVSIELTRAQLAERLLAAQSRVDSHKLRKGHLSGDDIGKLHAAGDLLRDSALFIDDSPSQHLPHVVSTAGRLVKEHNVRAVFIDSINQIEPPNARGFRPEQMAIVVRRIKRLARELQVPIIATANLNRASEERVDQRPRLSDLSESSAIEQYADTCLMLHRPGCFDGSLEDNIIEVIVAKQRNGPTGEVTLAYLKQYMRFENYAGDGAFGIE
jgi:replicative DNA helicase